MLFGNFESKQKERSDVVARYVLAGGKRRFFITTVSISSILFWLAMNIFFFVRGGIVFEGLILAGFEVGILLIGALLGIAICLKMWRNYTRLSDLTATNKVI